MDSYTKLRGLLSSDYEHPYDRRALNALKNTPGFETVTKKFWEYGIEKMLSVQCTGSNLEITKRNLPEIYELFKLASEILDMKIPAMYIKLQPELNAYATGVNNPIVVLSSAAVDSLTNEELLFIIGHELGHIKSNHVLYHQMAQVLPVIGQAIGQITLGVGQLFSMGVRIALLNWQRMSDFTADRAGLLTCQDVDVAASAMLKLAGLPKKYYSKDIKDEFIQQAKKFDEFDYENLSKVAKIISTSYNSHPWTVKRYAECFTWVNEGDYRDIFSFINSDREVEISSTASYCPNCGQEVNDITAFCGGCGKKFIII